MQFAAEVSTHSRTSLEAALNFIQNFFVFVPHKGVSCPFNEADHSCLVQVCTPEIESTLRGVRRHLESQLRSYEGARLYIEPDPSIGHFLKLPGWQDGYTRFEMNPEFSEACGRLLESWVIAVTPARVFVDDMCIWPQNG